MSASVPYLHRLYPDVLAPVIPVPDSVFERHLDPNTAIVRNVTTRAREVLNMATGERCPVLLPSSAIPENWREDVQNWSQSPLFGSRKKLYVYDSYRCYASIGNAPETLTELFQIPPHNQVLFLEPLQDRYCMLLSASRPYRDGERRTRYEYTFSLVFRDGLDGKLQTIDLLELLQIEQEYPTKDVGPVISISHDGSTVLYVRPHNTRLESYLLWDLSDPAQWEQVLRPPRLFYPPGQTPVPVGTDRGLSIGSVPTGRGYQRCAAALSDDGQTLYLTTGEYLYTQTIATSRGLWVQLDTPRLVQSAYRNSVDSETALPTSVSLVRTSSHLFVSVHFTSRLRDKNDDESVFFYDAAEQCDYLYGPDSLGRVELRRLRPPAASRYLTITRGHQLLLQDASGSLGIQGQSSQFPPPDPKGMVTGTVSDEGVVSMGLHSFGYRAGEIPTPSTKFHFPFRLTETVVHTASPNAAFVVGWDGTHLTIYSGCLHSGAYYHLRRTGRSESEWIQSMDTQLRDIRRYCQWLGSSDPRCDCVDVDALRKEMNLEGPSYDPYKDLVPCLVGRCRTLSSETILGDYFHQQRDCGPLQLCFQEISVNVTNSTIGGDILSTATCGSLFGVPTPAPTPDTVPDLTSVADPSLTETIPKSPLVTDPSPTDEGPEGPDWTWEWILGLCLVVLLSLVGLVFGGYRWRTSTQPNPRSLLVAKADTRESLSNPGSTQNTLPPKTRSLAAGAIDA